MKPEVTKKEVLSMQVCVPDYWIDAQVLIFANCENECGTENGWFIRKEGDKYLQGDPERNPCKDRKGYVHIMLDA